MLDLFDEGETRVGGAALRLRQAELAPYEVRAAHDRNHLVEGDPAAHAPTAEAAVRGEDQPLDRDVLQGFLISAATCSGRST
jgi:hypothetical protein